MLLKDIYHPPPNSAYGYKGLIILLYNLNILHIIQFFNEKVYIIDYLIFISYKEFLKNFLKDKKSLMLIQQQGFM